MFTYPVQPMFARSSCCLHILLAHPCLYYYLLSPQYTVLHILFHCTFYPLFFSYYILTHTHTYWLINSKGSAKPSVSITRNGTVAACAKRKQSYTSVAPA